MRVIDHVLGSCVILVIRVVVVVVVDGVVVAVDAGVIDVAVIVIVAVVVVVIEAAVESRTGSYSTLESSTWTCLSGKGLLENGMRSSCSNAVMNRGYWGPVDHLSL